LINFWITTYIYSSKRLPSTASLVAHHSHQVKVCTSCTVLSPTYGIYMWEHHDRSRGRYFASWSGRDI